MKRYYDTSAVIYFFSNSTSKHSASPYTRSPTDSYILSAVGFEEAVFFYLRSGGKDMKGFMEYLSKSFANRESNSLQLFKDTLRKCHSNGVIRVTDKSPGDGKVDVRDIRHYAAAIVLGADELVTEDKDFQLFEENQDLTPPYVETKPGIVLLSEK